MKKFLVFVAMAAAVLFTGCKKTSEFNKALVEDYAAVTAEYPGAVLFEVETKFNDNFTTADRKNLHVLAAREVFQVYSEDSFVIYVDRNFDEGTREVTTEKGHWMEDVVIKLDGLCDVNEALKALFKADIVTPDTNLMTLRNPLGPKPFEYPFYIFGSNHTNYVAVDAGTLEVKEFE